MDTMMRVVHFPRHLVLDGGLGLEIVRRLGSHFFYDHLWVSRANLTDLQVVQDIQTAYLEAGADLIMTNTYKPNPKLLMRELSLEKDEADHELRKAARDACIIRDKFWQTAKTKGRVRPLVAASIGTYGTFLDTCTDYCGDYVDTTSVQVMADAFKDKARPLMEGGVDILGFETIPASKEAEAVCEALEDFPGVKAWITYCCKDGKHVGHGEKFSDAVLTTLSSSAVVGVGINCTGPQYVTSLLKEIPDVIKEKKRIVVYPNSGETFNHKEERWNPSPDARPVADYVSEWMTEGADWIGGCCRVGVTDITRIKQAMETFLNNG